MNSHTKKIMIVLVIVIVVYLIYTNRVNPERFTDISPNSGYALCANEGQPCTINGPSNVIFGTSTSNTTFAIPNPSSSRGWPTTMQCTNQAFGGDPAPGIVKACYVKPVGTLAVQTIQTQATPVQTQATPVQTQATPVQIQATPVQTQATPVQTQAISNIDGLLSQISYRWGMLCGKNSANTIYCRAIGTNAKQTYGDYWKQFNTNGVTLNNIGTDGTSVFGLDAQGKLWSVPIATTTCAQDPNNCTLQSKTSSNIPPMQQVAIDTSSSPSLAAIRPDGTIFTVSR